MRVVRPEGATEAREVAAGRLPTDPGRGPDLDPARVRQATGRQSAVIAGATVTDSTVSVISRRQAARRFAGSQSLSMSSGPIISLSPGSPSRARAVCASSSVLASFSKVSWPPAGPTSQARRAAGSCHRDPRRRVRSPRPPRGLPPARRAWGRVGRGRVRPDRVQHHLLVRSALTAASSAAVRARIAAPLAAAVGIDHHPRPARPAARRFQAGQHPL